MPHHAMARVRRKGIQLLSSEPPDKPASAAGTATSIRRGLVAILPDLRGFARFLTRDTGAADDLVQETIMRALAADAQFQDGTSLKAWLFTIQRNAFYEQQRRRKREHEILDDIVSDGTLVSSTATGPSRGDDVADLTTLLWRLPDVFREALILVGAQEMTHEEAALVCGVPVGTMKARVSRARAQLAELAGTRLAPV